jgi:hypothetical protein
LNSCKSLLFHGGDTGSIPVRAANTFKLWQSVSARREIRRIAHFFDV